MDCTHSPEERRRRPSFGSGVRSCTFPSVRTSAAVRVLARVRPLIGTEEEDTTPCIRPVGTTQLEVLLEPRALLTESTSRNRRRTTGGLGSRSAAALAEAVNTFGIHDSNTSSAGNRGLESRTFTFDQVLDASVSDDQVFAEIQDELAAALDGEAVCILAYGATGSGKTHTVSNIAERTARELDRQAELLEQEGLRLELMVQIVEIYNEQFRDLLIQDSSNHEAPRLKMSHPTSSATLQGAAHRSITRDGSGSIMRSLQAALRFGQAQRSTSATAAHGRSSRSHLVMMLYLITCDPLTGVNRRVGRFTLVDLAGSERVKTSEVTGDRLKEAQHINRSLSALADVVVAKEKGVPHVPYRNSKLTHLLQDALGGQPNSRTIIIVALPPTRSALGETLHSLQLSSRLSSIAVQKASTTFSLDHPSRQRDEDSLRIEAEMSRLRTENAQLRCYLEERDRRLDELSRQLEMVLDGRLPSRRAEVEAKTFQAWPTQAQQTLYLDKSKVQTQESNEEKDWQESHILRTRPSVPISPVFEADSSLERSDVQEVDSPFTVPFDKSCVGKLDSEETAKDIIQRVEPELQQPQPEPEEELASSEGLSHSPTAEVTTRSHLGESPSLSQMEIWSLQLHLKDKDGNPNLLFSKDPEAKSCARKLLCDGLDGEWPPSDVKSPTTSPSDSASWKWIDPKDASALLNKSIPSPSRAGTRKRSTGDGQSSPRSFCGISFLNESDQGSGFQMLSSIDQEVSEDCKRLEEDLAQPKVDCSPAGMSFKQVSAPITSTRHTMSETNREARARSASLRSPREYIVEALTPQRAREIELKLENPAQSGHNSPTRFDMATPKSPALLLKCPYDDCSEENSSLPDVSCISVSSNEGDICERLKLALCISDTPQPQVLPPPMQQRQQVQQVPAVPQVQQVHLVAPSAVTSASSRCGTKPFATAVTGHPSSNSSAKASKSAASSGSVATCAARAVSAEASHATTSGWTQSKTQAQTVSSPFDHRHASPSAAPGTPRTGIRAADAHATGLNVRQGARSTSSSPNGRAGHYTAALGMQGSFGSHSLRGTNCRPSPFASPRCASPASQGQVQSFGRSITLRLASSGSPTTHNSAVLRTPQRPHLSQSTARTGSPALRLGVR